MKKNPQKTRLKPKAAAAVKSVVKAAVRDQMKKSGVTRGAAPNHMNAIAPRSLSSGKSTIVTGRDLWQKVDLTGTHADDKIAELAISPFNIFFRRARIEACLWQRFRCRKIRVTYNGFVGTETDGALVGMFDSDVKSIHPSGITSLQDLASSTAFSECPLYTVDGTAHSWEWRPLAATKGFEYFVGSDLSDRFNALGHFMLFTRLNPGTSTVVGELWVDYTWEFEVPLVNESLLPAASTLLYAVGPSAYNGYPMPKNDSEIVQLGGSFKMASNPDPVLTTIVGTVATAKFFFTPLSNFLGKWLVSVMTQYHSGSATPEQPTTNSLISTPQVGVNTLNLVDPVLHFNNTGATSNWETYVAWSALVEITQAAITADPAAELEIDVVHDTLSSYGNVTVNRRFLFSMVRVGLDWPMTISGMPNAIRNDVKSNSLIWRELTELKNSLRQPPVLLATEPVSLETKVPSLASPCARPTIFMAREPRAQSLPPSSR